MMKREVYVAEIKRFANVKLLLCDEALAYVMINKVSLNVSFIETLLMEAQECK